MIILKFWWFTLDGGFICNWFPLSNPVTWSTLVVDSDMDGLHASPESNIMALPGHGYLSLLGKFVEPSQWNRQNKGAALTELKIG